MFNWSIYTWTKFNLIVLKTPFWKENLNNELIPNDKKKIDWIFFPATQQVEIMQYYHTVYK